MMLTLLATSLDRILHGRSDWQPEAPASSVAIFAGDARLFPHTIGLGVISQAGCSKRAHESATVADNQLISLNAINTTGSNQVVTVSNAHVLGTSSIWGTAQSIFGTPFGNVPRNAVERCDSEHWQFFCKFKNFKSWREHANFEMHATALNAFNHFKLLLRLIPAWNTPVLGGTPGGGTGFGLANVSLRLLGRTVVCGWQDSPSNT